MRVGGCVGCVCVYVCVCVCMYVCMYVCVQAVMFESKPVAAAVMPAEVLTLLPYRCSVNCSLDVDMCVCHVMLNF